MILHTEATKTIIDSIVHNRNRLLALTVHRMKGDRHRCFANTIPKAGTHLIERCLWLMPGIHPAGCHLRAGSGKDVRNMLWFLRLIGQGCFVTAHLAFSEERLSILESLGYRHILLIRDPRDVAVSLAFFLARPAEPFSRKANIANRSFFRNLRSMDERITVAITGEPSIALPSLDQKYETYLPWVEHGSLLVKFEDLVGPRGGGSLERQIVSIMRMASHLGIMLSEKQAAEIADRCYSTRSMTYRRGLIGDWRNHFRQEHKTLLKEQAGRWLIKLGYEQSNDW